MAPTVRPPGTSRVAASQRCGSAGWAGSRSRRSGRREATSSAFVPGRLGSAVVSWCERPPAARAAARPELGAVARNSDSATTSGDQRSSWRAMAAARLPPPARMFHERSAWSADCAMSQAGVELDAFTKPAVVPRGSCLSSGSFSDHAIPARSPYPPLPFLLAAADEMGRTEECPDNGGVRS